MRKLTLIVTIAFAVVVGLTVATIALAQEERTDSEHLARFAALMQYVRSEPTPADIKAETVPTLAYLDTVLSGTYITGFITPYTGETEGQVKARLESLAVEDRFTAIMVESYRVSSDPTLLDIVHQLLPLYYVQFFTTSDGLDASREFLTGANIQTLADAFDPDEYAMPRPRTSGGVDMPMPTPTPQPNLALVFDPDGPDRDCSDFANWQDAQAFYWATEDDSHDLDPDYDGVACETLPGAPQSEVVIVTPTPVAGTEITISGSGTATRAITLIPGLWVVDMEVSGNQDCTSGFCFTEIFAVEIESVNESGDKLLGSDFGIEWTGSTTLRTGDGLFDHPSGPQIVSVDAYGSWSITFTKQ